jgi:hypothetical protein
MTMFLELVVLLSLLLQHCLLVLLVTCSVNGDVHCWMQNIAGLINQHRDAQAEAPRCWKMPQAMAV